MLLPLVLVWLVFAVVGVCEGTTSADEPNLVIRDNVIEENGFGIYLGWYGYFATEIAGNTISGNGEGIRVVNAYTAIRNNSITDNITGVRVTDTHQGEQVTEVKGVLLSQNVITGNVMYGLENLAAMTVDARGNWWGDAAGPRSPGSAESQGVASDRITGMIDYSNWLSAPSGQHKNDSMVTPTSEGDKVAVPDTLQPEAQSTQPTTPTKEATAPSQESNAGETDAPAIAPSEAQPTQGSSPSTSEAVEISATKLDLLYDVETLKLYQPSVYCLCTTGRSGDGNTDVVMGRRYDQQVFVWLGDGGGKFDLKGNFPCDVHAQELLPADVDGDGVLDIVAIGRAREGVTLLLGDGAGGFGEVLDRIVPPSKYEVSGATLIPRVGGTSVGVVLTSESSNAVLIYAWDAEEHSWTKEPDIPVTSPRSPVVGDFNGDHYPDVALVSDTETISVLWGRKGGWEDPAIYYQAQSPVDAVSGADVDANGCADIVFALEGGEVGLLLGNKDNDASYRYIGPSGSETVRQLIIDDVDNDGRMDVLILSARTGKLTLMQNISDGSFAEARTIPGAYSCDTVAVGNKVGVIHDLLGFDRASGRVVFFLPKGRNR